MKKISVVILVSFIAFTLSACNHNLIKQGEKYTMNASYSYVGNLERMEVSYDLIISGARKEIKNIDAYEILINMDYLDLMIENGPHQSQKTFWGNSRLRITGSFTFSIGGRSKEEIDILKLLEGVNIINKDKNEVILKFK